MQNLFTVTSVKKPNEASVCVAYTVLWNQTEHCSDISNEGHYFIGKISQEWGAKHFLFKIHSSSDSLNPPVSRQTTQKVPSYS